MFDTIWKKEFLRFLYIYPWCYMKLRSNCVLQSLTNPREQGAHYIECYSELDLTFLWKKKRWKAVVPLHSGPLRLLSVVQDCLFSPSSHSSYSSSLSFLLLLQWDKETKNKRRFQNHTRNVFYLAVQVNDPAESCCWLVCKICECSKVSRKGIVLKLCIIPSLSEHTPSHLFSFPDWKGKRKKKKSCSSGRRKIHHTPPVSLCMFMISPCVFRRLRCYGFLHGNMWRPSW